MRAIALSAGLFLFATSAFASPINVGGYSFSEETAFADDAFLVSGTIRFNCLGGGWGVNPEATSVAEAVAGSDLSHCVNNDTGNSGIVEAVFSDNRILNDTGPDLVVFELSGAMAAGTPDPRENFGVSLHDGTAFTPFTYFDPIATGTSFCGDPAQCLDTFAVEIDLSSFGFPDGHMVERVRLHIFDVGLGTKSADIGALGALNSAPIPEPSTGLLVGGGLLFLAFRWSRRRNGSIRNPSLLASVLIATLFGDVMPSDSLADTISCSVLRAQIFDGIPGPGDLVGPSTGGCPFQAAATSMDIDANASATVTFSGDALEHSHAVDLTGSATTRVAISEAFLSFQAPVDTPSLVLAPAFSIEGTTYSAVLQLEAPGERTTYFTGVPVLAGESTLQGYSAGPIPVGSIAIIPGASYSLYSRLSTFGDFDQSNALTLTFTLVPEPSTSLLLGSGLLGLTLFCRRRGVPLDPQRLAIPESPILCSGLPRMTRPT
jgi:hypothetical protein